MTIRELEDGEDAPFTGQIVYVAEEDGVPTGWVAASVVDDVAWLHNIQYEGDNPMVAARLMMKARTTIAGWGYDSFRCNVLAGTPLAELMMLNGYKIVQVMFEVNTDADRPN